jgi:hypothetical protein
MEKALIVLSAFSLFSASAGFPQTDILRKEASFLLIYHRNIIIMHLLTRRPERSSAVIRDVPAPHFQA